MMDKNVQAIKSLLMKVGFGAEGAMFAAEYLVANGVTVKEKTNELSIQELETMGNQPVWFQDGERGWWDVFDTVIREMGMKPYVLTRSSKIFLVNEYGKTWRVYREPPKENNV